jgi:hypothetical protein
MAVMTTNLHIQVAVSAATFQIPAGDIVIPVAPQIAMEDVVEHRIAAAPDIVITPVPLTPLLLVLQMEIVWAVEPVVIVLIMIRPAGVRQ